MLVARYHCLKHLQFVFEVELTVKDPHAALKFSNFYLVLALSIFVYLCGEDFYVLYKSLAELLFT